MSGYNYTPKAVIEAWPNSLAPVSATLHPVTNTTRFESPFGRFVQTQEVVGCVWTLTASFSLDADQAREMRALRARLRGAAGVFYFKADASIHAIPPQPLNADGFPTYKVAAEGVRTVGGDVGFNSLRTTGWDAAEGELLLSKGEYVSFDDAYGYRQLFLVQEDAYADAEGSATLQVEPPLTAPPPEGSVLHTDCPSLCFRLIDDTQLEVRDQADGVFTATMSAVQASNPNVAFAVDPLPPVPPLPATSGPVLAFSAASLSAELPEFPAGTLTLTNNGEEPVYGLRVAVPENPRFTRLVSTTCGDTLLPGESCELNLESPAWTPGSYNITATAVGANAARVTAVVPVNATDTSGGARFIWVFEDTPGEQVDFAYSLTPAPVVQRNPENLQRAKVLIASAFEKQRFGAVRFALKNVGVAAGDVSWYSRAIFTGLGVPRFKIFDQWGTLKFVSLPPPEVIEDFGEGDLVTVNVPAGEKLIIEFYSLDWSIPEMPTQEPLQGGELNFETPNPFVLRADLRGVWSAPSKIADLSSTLRVPRIYVGEPRTAPLFLLQNKGPYPARVDGAEWLLPDDTNASAGTEFEFPAVTRDLPPKQLFPLVPLPVFNDPTPDAPLGHELRVSSPQYVVPGELRDYKEWDTGYLPLDVTVTPTAPGPRSTTARLRIGQRLVSGKVNVIGVPGGRLRLGALGDQQEGYPVTGGTEGKHLDEFASEFYTMTQPDSGELRNLDEVQDITVMLCNTSFDEPLTITRTSTVSADFQLRLQLDDALPITLQPREERQVTFKVRYKRRQAESKAQTQLTFGNGFGRYTIEWRINDGMT